MKNKTPWLIPNEHSAEDYRRAFAYANMLLAKMRALEAERAKAERAEPKVIENTEE